MRVELNSRERLLCAMRGGEPDHVPLWNLWRSQHQPFDYRSQVERARFVTQMGLDDTLLLQPPLHKTEHYDANLVESVKIIRKRYEPAGRERYPLLTKEYHTGEGMIRQVVQQTPDYPFGEDIRLFSDHNVPRSVEFAIKTAKDIPALRNLLKPASIEQMREFHEQAAELRREARLLGVALEGGWTTLGDAALWLLGTENLLYCQMDQPGFVEELLDVICEWELGRMDLLLEEGVDVIVHSAWYESTNFWSPRTYRKFLKPRLKKMVQRAHEGGALFSYIITSAWIPLAKDIEETGVDALIGVDPVQDRIDLRKVRESFTQPVCLWGGINGALTLGHGTVLEIQQATREAIDTLGPGGGFVLYAVDQVVKETPWENVLAMIDTWKELASYPIGL